jgi:type IV pilus assembly protein PilY1
MAAKYGGFTDSNANSWPDQAKECVGGQQQHIHYRHQLHFGIPSPATGYTGTPTNYAGQ